MDAQSPHRVASPKSSIGPDYAPPPMPASPAAGTRSLVASLKKGAHGGNIVSPMQNVLHPDETCGDLVNLENQVGYLRAVGNALSPTRIPYHLLLVQLYGRRPRTGSSTCTHSNRSCSCHGDRADARLCRHVRGLTPYMAKRERGQPPERSVSHALRGLGRHVLTSQCRTKVPANRLLTHRPSGP